MNGFSSKAVHGPRLRQDLFGSLRPPLYDSAAFEFASSQEIMQAFEGKKPAHTYSRVTNPTVEEFEQRIRLITDAHGVIAVSSGMAAIADTIFTLTEPGACIITSRHLFSHTLSLFTTTLSRWSLAARFVDMTDLAAVVNAIDHTTRCIFLESITNPQLEVADITGIVEIAQKANIPVILDGTMTTPYLFASKTAGVAVEIISSTKYLSGGATSVGGLIIDNGVFDWSKVPALSDAVKKFGASAFIARLRKEVYRNFGSCLSPHNAWLQILGLETMPLRIEKSGNNAFAVATFLEQQSKVLSVNYPGLPGAKSHGVAARLFPRGCGGVLTFDAGSREKAFALMDHLSLIRKATNIHDNKTLIIHPASTIFCEFSAEERAAMKVPEGLIRLSAGIEDIDDIISDLSQGLSFI